MEKGMPLKLYSNNIETKNRSLRKQRNRTKRSDCYILSWILLTIHTATNRMGCSVMRTNRATIKCEWSVSIGITRTLVTKGRFWFSNWGTRVCVCVQKMKCQKVRMNEKPEMTINTHWTIFLLNRKICQFMYLTLFITGHYCHCI